MFWALCAVLVSEQMDYHFQIDYCICQMYMGADDVDGVDGIINTRIAFAV